MKLDVITIFPQYLTPLRESLLGRAIADGLIGLDVHDLRDFAPDRHRTVDDTPYGGGAGMVMKPDVWGRAIEQVAAGCGAGYHAHRADSGRATVSTRPSRRSWPAADRLIFACGRYEGIDQRVVDHAATSMDVRELSIGDYVLAGGEAAVLVMVEAVARLIPGVLGNPLSAGDRLVRDRIRGSARVSELHQTA